LEEHIAVAAATTFAPAQAYREPRRFDWRVAIGGFLLLAAFGGSVAFWSATSDAREVLVAARDVPAGAQLTDGDLVTARVRVDDAMYRAAVPAGDRQLYIGRQLAQPLHAQQLVARAQLSAKPPLEPQQLAHTVPVSAETAAGGRIQHGSSVRVLATADKGKAESRTYVVLPRVVVYDVGFDERTAVVNTAGAAGETADAGSRARGRIAWVTLAVDEAQAVALARARWNGELDLALLPPEGKP
jgi:Flp pilus assembly protein CpaB